VADGAPRGSVEIDSFDLAMIEPFVPGRLGGHVTLRVKGGLRDASIEVEVRDLVTERVDEERVHGQVRLVQDDAGYGVRDLRIESASGRLVADGDLHLPKGEMFRPTGHLRGQFSLAGAYRLFAHRKPTADARVRFDLRSTMHGDGGRANGTIHLDHFTQREDPGEVALAFDIVGEREKQILRVEKCELTTRGFEARCQGVIHRGARWSADLAGSASGDLGRLHHLAAHFSRALARTALSGQASLTLHALKRKADGTIAIHCAARATDLTARGMGADIRSHHELRAEFDGKLTDAGGTLIVKSARVADLELAGRASGLRIPGAMPESSGTLRGTVKLTPTLMRLLDIDAIETPRGEAVLDLSFSTANKRVRVEGSLETRDLRFRAGAYVHEDPDIRGHADVEWDGVALSGQFELDSTHLFANVRDFRIEPAQPRITARGKLRVKDPEPLRRLLLDDSWTWAGAHDLDDVEFEFQPGSMGIRGTVTAPRLRLAYDGHGIDREATTVRARVRHADGLWTFDESSIQLPDRALTVNAERIRIGADGAILGRATARGPLKSFHDRVALLGIHEIHGDAEATIDFEHRRGTPWRISAPAGLVRT